jgi:hypothetical protein
MFHHPAQQYILAAAFFSVSVSKTPPDYPPSWPCLRRARSSDDWAYAGLVVVLRLL